jgi:metal-dependent amidase/aminoacylase/carboxypeptidase family protein
MDAIVKHCAEGAALALDCHVTFSSSGADYAPMKRETRLEETAARLLEKRGFRVGPVTPALGSSDMGNVSQRCPALQPLLAITGEVIPWHTKDFAAACLTPQAEDAMRRGAETLVELTLLEMAPTTTHQNARLSGLD